MPYLAQRAMTVAGVKYAPGTAVPVQDIGRNQLRSLMNLGRLKFLPEATASIEYIARRPLVVAGIKVQPGEVVHTDALTAQQVDAAASANMIVKRERPLAAVPTAPVSAPKRRGRPPRRVVATPVPGGV